MEYPDTTHDSGNHHAPQCKRILIVGAGFAGMYAALSAACLRDEQSVSPETLDIAVVAPEPRLVIRPRLYERAPETMVAPLTEVFEAVDVRYEQGQVDVIDSASKSVVIVGANGARRTLPYDRLVLAAGSQGFKPDIPGLAKYGFSVDQLDGAIALDQHLKALANRPSSAAPYTGTFQDLLRTLFQAMLAVLADTPSPGEQPRQASPAKDLPSQHSPSVPHRPPILLPLTVSQ